MSKVFKSDVLVILVPLLIILVVLAGMLYVSQKNDRQPSLYLVPNGYVGMVSVEYGQQGAPELQKEGKFIVYPFPESGVLKTSSLEPEYGVASDRYYYVDETGNRTEINPETGIHGGSIGGKEGSPPTLSFFVGTQEDWDKYTKKLQNPSSTAPSK